MSHLFSYPCWWWQQLLPFSWTTHVCRRMLLTILFPSLLSCHLPDTPSLTWSMQPPFSPRGKMLGGPWVPHSPSGAELGSQVSPCRCLTPLQQQEEEGRPWNSTGGMFLWGVEADFVYRKKKKFKKITFHKLGSQPYLLAPAALISLFPRGFIYFISLTSAESVSPAITRQV